MDYFHSYSYFPINETSQVCHDSVGFSMNNVYASYIYYFHQFGHLKQGSFVIHWQEGISTETIFPMDRYIVEQAPERVLS